MSIALRFVVKNKYMLYISSNITIMNPATNEEMKVKLEAIEQVQGYRAPPRSFYFDLYHDGISTQYSAHFRGLYPTLSDIQQALGVKDLIFEKVDEEYERLHKKEKNYMPREYFVELKEDDHLPRNDLDLIVVRIK